MLNTLQQFIDCVSKLADISLAYDVFEFECSEELRSEIYAHAEKDSNEPFRSAMHNLGFDAY